MTDAIHICHHEFVYSTARMPEGYDKPVSGPFCRKCGLTNVTSTTTCLINANATAAVLVNERANQLLGEVEQLRLRLYIAASGKDAAEAYVKALHGHVQEVIAQWRTEADDSSKKLRSCADAIEGLFTRTLSEP